MCYRDRAAKLDTASWTVHKHYSRGLAWQVTNSRGYASLTDFSRQVATFHVNSATIGSELTHESSRPAAESRDHFWRLP